MGKPDQKIHGAGVLLQLPQNYVQFSEVRAVTYCYMKKIVYYLAQHDKKYKNKSSVAAATEGTVLLCGPEINREVRLTNQQ